MSKKNRLITIAEMQQTVDKVLKEQSKKLTQKQAKELRFMIYSFIGLPLYSMNEMG